MAGGCLAGGWDAEENMRRDPAVVFPRASARTSYVEAGQVWSRGVDVAVPLFRGLGAG